MDGVTTHDAMLRGMHLHMRDSNRTQNGDFQFNVDLEETTETSIRFAIDVKPKTYSEGFWDEASGKPLDYDKVIQARGEEMKEARRCNLYKKVPSSSWRYPSKPSRSSCYMRGSVRTDID